MLTRRAMTLVEIVVAMAIVGVMAAALYPTIMGRLQRAQTAALGRQLQGFREAIGHYRENVGRYPNRLRQLTTQPASGARDICLGTIPAANLARWRGPYMSQAIVTDSIRVGDATVLDTLFREPVNTAGGQPGMLRMVAFNVDSIPAMELERQLDGNGNLLDGNIMWFPTLFGLNGLLVYSVPVRGC